MNNVTMLELVNFYGALIMIIKIPYQTRVLPTGSTTLVLLSQSCFALISVIRQKTSSALKQRNGTCTFKCKYQDILFKTTDFLIVIINWLFI